MDCSCTPFLTQLAALPSPCSHANVALLVRAMDPPSRFDEENYSCNSSYLSLSSDGDEVATNPNNTIRSTPIILQIITTRITKGGRTTHQGHIYLTPYEIDYYQNPLTVYFTSKGSKVHSLHCPDIDTYLKQYNLNIINITFVNNLPPHIIDQVTWLRHTQVNKHILPSWDWPPEDNNVPSLSSSSISRSTSLNARSNNHRPDPPEDSISISSVNLNDMGMNGRKMGGRFMGGQRMGGQTYSHMPHSFPHNNSFTVDSSLSMGGMSSPSNSDASVASFTPLSNTLSYKTPNEMAEPISIAPATAPSNIAPAITAPSNIAPATAPSNKESSTSALSMSQYKIKDLNLENIIWGTSSKLIPTILNENTSTKQSVSQASATIPTTNSNTTLPSSASHVSIEDDSISSNPVATLSKSIPLSSSNPVVTSTSIPLSSSNPVVTSTSIPLSSSNPVVTSTSIPLSSSNPVATSSKLIPLLSSNPVATWSKSDSLSSSYPVVTSSKSIPLSSVLPAVTSQSNLLPSTLNDSVSSYSHAVITNTSTSPADTPVWCCTKKFGIPDSCNKNNTDAWHSKFLPHTDFTFHPYDTEG